jgi:hypothetical protein
MSIGVQAQERTFHLSQVKSLGEDGRLWMRIKPSKSYVGVTLLKRQPLALSEMTREDGAFERRQQLA